MYKLYVPELTGKLFKGFSYGWVITTENSDTGLNEIHLINPFTRAQIHLPPRTFADGVILCSPEVNGKCTILTDTSDYECTGFAGQFTLNEFRIKIVLSSDSYNDECVMVATSSRGHLIWCKFNDKEWRYVDTAGLYGFVDILYSKSYLYALTYEGGVIMFENIGTELETKFKEITADRVPMTFETPAYLAECSDGSLIVVVRHFVVKDKSLICTKKFAVYKLYSYPNSRWVKVKSIGDDVLFVDFGSVRSIPSTNLPEFKKNHIYFCDFAKSLGIHEEHKFRKSGKNVKSYARVFSLEDGNVKPFQGFGDFIWPRPIWTNIATAVEIAGTNVETRIEGVFKAGEGRFNGVVGRRARAHDEEEDRQIKMPKYKVGGLMHPGFGFSYLDSV